MTRICIKTKHSTYKSVIFKYQGQFFSTDLRWFFVTYIPVLSYTKKYFIHSFFMRRIISFLFKMLQIAENSMVALTRLRHLM